MHSHSFSFSVSALVYTCIIDFRGGPSRILPYRPSVSSPVSSRSYTETSFHRIYVRFEILANCMDLCKSFNRFTDAPASSATRICYTLVCVSVSVHAHFLRFLSSPLVPHSALSLANTPNHRYWMLHLFDDRHELSNKFFLLVCFIHFTRLLTVTNENICTVVLEHF